MAVTYARPAPPDVAHSVAEWGRPDRQLPHWRGRPCQQFPADMLRYAELCWELKPPFVVEVGVAEGGTSLFLADVLNAVGGGTVWAIDIQPVFDVGHPPNITMVRGDSVSADVVDQIGDWAAGDRGLVLLDGNHASAQVACELDLYAPLADALVVEDTIMRWLPQYDDGPHNALDRWLPNHPEWQTVADPVPGPTQHPGGWLRRR